MQRERKRGTQIKKDYKKLFVEHLRSDYWRAFEALVGSKDIDMELVIHSFASNAFYKEAREFLCVQGKFMQEGHLLHLKEDPKTILSLYRMFMLHYRTNQMNTIDNKPLMKKPKKLAGSKSASINSLGEGANEDSDYSENDFSDLLSNKQIEENIKVFFDRMHELINPIDQTRLKLDSVQQIKNTVKTFYKKKAEVSDKMLRELDQMTAERPIMTKIKQEQFGDPDMYNQANLHADRNRAKMPRV